MAGPRASVREIATPVGLARAHVMSRSKDVTLVMGHGAGGGVDAPDLQELARLAQLRGLGVVLVEQPWRVAGKRVAEAPVRLDQAWQAVIPELRLPGRVIVGGRSAGARVAARSAGPLRKAGVNVRGALLLAFPLHFPGKPDSDRSDELGLLRRRVRTVVVQGSRDPFGTADEVRAVTSAVVIEAAGADHSLRTTGRSGAAVVAGLDRALGLVARFGE